MAPVFSVVKSRVLAVVGCGALLLGAISAVTVASPPPLVAVSPNHITAENCSTVTVSGRNFVGGGNVALLYVDGAFQRAADIAPDGTFAISFDACSVASGRHTAEVVSDPDGLADAHVFTVQ